MGCQYIFSDTKLVKINKLVGNHADKAVARHRDAGKSLATNICLWLTFILKIAL